jgi:hypothetical protein
VLRAKPSVDVAARRPPDQPPAEHEPRGLVLQHERAVRELLEADDSPVPQPLAVQPRVHGIRARLSHELEKADVVGPAAQRTRSVACSECGRLVQEEELGELARLQQPAPAPASELEPAGDPALAVVPPPDAPLRVVEAAAVAVDEAPGGIGDELAERSDSVLERHQPQPRRGFYVSCI